MANRKLPARRAKTTSDSGRRTTKRKIHSEPPILSDSASSSTGLNMGETHSWEPPEEIALFREADALLTSKPFSKKKKLYAEIATVLAQLFPKATVPFNEGVVKNKFATMKSKVVGGRELSTCTGEKIHCSAIVAKFVYGESGSETTASVADTVNVNNWRIPTINECITLVESLEGLTPIEKADASELMRLDQAAREAFMSFSDEQVRLFWIKKRIGLVNNPGTA